TIDAPRFILWIPASMSGDYNSVAAARGNLCTAVDRPGSGRLPIAAHVGERRLAASLQIDLGAVQTDLQHREVADRTDQIHQGLVAEYPSRLVESLFADEMIFERLHREVVVCALVVGLEVGLLARGEVTDDVFGYPGGQRLVHVRVPRILRVPVARGDQDAE